MLIQSCRATRRESATKTPRLIARYPFRDRRRDGVVERHRDVARVPVGTRRRRVAEHDADPDGVRTGHIGGAQPAVLHVATVAAVPVVVRLEHFPVCNVGDGVDRHRFNGRLIGRGRHGGLIELLVKRASSGEPSLDQQPVALRPRPLHRGRLRVRRVLERRRRRRPARADVVVRPVLVLVREPSLQLVFVARLIGHAQRLVGNLAVVLARPDRVGNVHER